MRGWMRSSCRGWLLPLSLRRVCGGAGLESQRSWLGWPWICSAGICASNRCCSAVASSTGRPCGRFRQEPVAAGIWDQFGFGFAGGHGDLARTAWKLGRVCPPAEEQAALNRMGLPTMGLRLSRTLNRQVLAARDSALPSSGSISASRRSHPWIGRPTTTPHLSSCWLPWPITR